MENKLELIKEARGCNNCLQWVKHCNAECCRQFRVGLKQLQKHRLGYAVKTTLTEDAQHYYKIHGCYYTRGLLIMPKRSGFRVTQEGEFIVFHRNCDNLEGNSCKEYESGNRPMICKGFDETTGKNPYGASYATPNCLCNFKVKE